MEFSGGGGFGEGRACDGDMTFFKNSPSYSLPTGKSFQSDADKFVNFAAIQSKIHQQARRRGGSKGSNEPPLKFDNGGLKYK